MRSLSKFSVKQRSLLAENGYDRQAVIVFCGLSFVLHIVFFGAVLAMQNYSFHRRVVPPSIQVNLVSVSSVKTRPAAPPVREPVPETGNPVVSDQQQMIETKDAPVPEPKETVVVPSRSEQPSVEIPKEPQPVPVKKKSLKSKTFKTEKVLDSARKTIEANVEKERQTALNKALARLKEQVAEKSVATPKPQSSLGVMSENGGSEGSTRAIDLYNLELMYRIQQNWAFNERLAGSDKSIQVRILIKILKNGELRDIWFETRSGNKYLDESAAKAIKKSSPLPPLPKGYVSYDVGLIFTPSGLQ